jgi:hypothetical protein
MLATLQLSLAPSGRPRWLHAHAWSAVVGIAAYGAVAPLLAVLHELIVLAAAGLLSHLAWLAAASGAMRALPLDPIYTSALLLTVGGIEPHGLALAGPVGGLLHERWPGLFDAPTLVSASAWASAIVAPGSTVISRWLCAIAADAILIGAGLLALRQARGGRAWLGVAGAIVQAHVVVAHLIDLPPDLADVEAAGIPFAISMLVSGDVQAGPRLAVLLDGMADPFQDAILGLGMVALAYLPVAGLALSWRLARAAGGLARAARRQPFFLGGLRWRRLRLRAPQLGIIPLTAGPAGLGRAVALATLAVGVALSPLGNLADAETRFLAVAVDAEPEGEQPVPTVAPLADQQAPSEAPVPIGPPLSLADQPPSALVDQPPALAPAPPTAQPVVPVSSPSSVAVAGSGFRYEYTVNGTPQVIRGIGYNVRYRRFPDAERIRLLDRDFAALKQAGVNTVFGWQPDEFDTLLLDAAERHGLGVAPPFDLDPDASYADPAVRDRITDDVLAWVARYREHPAVRMWAIGNEVLHKLVYPSWMPIRSEPAREQRARDFASFYVELIDKVHAADPNHPIVHRDAEDAYFSWLREAMQTGGRRPWLIYGVNAYTPRLAEILSSWPSHGWDVPLMVSEFAPGGMSPSDRPQGFRSMWKMIRGASDWVLGGAVYAWTTDGPEEVDRVFGLVDADGNAVDGAFAMVGSLYQGMARQDGALGVGYIYQGPR